MSADAGAPPDVPGAGEGGGSAEIPASIAYRVSLPEFEGPLDLLLHLCKSHEIDILQIPIAFVTEKYLEYLDVMQSMSVEVAAEYLVMAATLCYLKSRELVPTPEPLEIVADEAGDEALDPKEELIRRLLEYQKYKDAAEQLGARPIEGRNVFGRGIKLEGPGGEAPLADHSVWKLIESFSDILKKAGPKVTHDVLFDRMSITERINQLIDKIEQGGGRFRFDGIVDLNLPEIELRNQLVVTLLAILELAKLKVICVLQDPESETFYIARREGATMEEARRVTVTSEAHGAQDEDEEGGDDAGGDAVLADEPEAAIAGEALPMGADEDALSLDDLVPEGDEAHPDHDGRDEEPEESNGGS